MFTDKKVGGRFRRHNADETKKWRSKTESRRNRSQREDKKKGENYNAICIKKESATNKEE